MPAWKPILAVGMTPDEFDYHVKTRKNTWAKTIVLHHSGSPSLADRPGGYDRAYLQEIEKHLRDEQKFPAGPHLMIDDNKIWLFTPLITCGVHSPSFNRTGIGVEMLGDYSKESFTEGRGGRVQQNTIAALVSLYNWFDLDPTEMLLHKDDKLTHQDCPGANVNKEDLIQAVIHGLGGVRGDHAPHGII